MWNLPKSSRWTTVTCLALAMTQLGCGNLTVSTPKAAILWMVGIDITASIPADHFLLTRDQMFPQVILSRVRPRDEIHVVPINTNPEQHVHVTRLVRTAGLDKELAALLTTVQTQIVHTQNPKVMTNIGGVLAYAKRLSTLLQEERSRAAAQGKAAAPAPRIVVVLFTDGKPEGRQTMPLSGPWPTNVSVWFWGVEPAAEAALTHWATTTMELPETQLHLVRFSDWETVAAQVFGRHVDRPHPNLAFLKRLQAPQTMARR